MASGVFRLGLPSASSTAPPAELMASDVFTVRPSYLAYWPAKQPMLFSLAMEHMPIISSQVLGAVGTRSLR